MKDRMLWQKAWRAAHAVGAVGLLALAAMLFASLPARAAHPGEAASLCTPTCQIEIDGREAP